MGKEHFPPMAKLLKNDLSSAGRGVNKVKCPAWLEHNLTHTNKAMFKEFEELLL